MCCRANAYEILVGEFASIGGMLEHKIESGPKAGSINYKQQWGHKRSSYSWLWHRVIGKDYFARDKAWKAARAIINQGLPGSERLKLILKYADKAADPTDEAALYPRDIDMIHRVAGVKAVVGGKLPLSVFENPHVKAYVQGLNPKHRPPHRLERIRILEVMMDYAIIEVSKILQERRDELGEAFMSGTIDFFTDPHRREAFGVFVIDTTAHSYHMANGQSLFMSKETKERLGRTLFASDTPILEILEVPLNFEKFDQASKLPTTLAHIFMYSTYLTLTLLICQRPPSTLLNG